MNDDSDSPIEVKIEGSILSDSKKIKKSPSIHNKSPSNKGANNLKKYETFCNAKKSDILTDIKDGLVKLRKQELGDNGGYVEDVLKLLDGVDLDAYNKLLKTILSKHVDSFNPSAKILTQWRKKIKCWIHNSGRPETRGKPLIPVERLETFRERLVEILKSLPYRAFPLLRSKILGVLEEFAKLDPEYYESSVFNGNSCSKHWWFNFMQKNQDIKKLWEQIPLERIVNKVRPEIRWPRQGGDSENSALCIFDNPILKPGFQTIPDRNLKIGPSLNPSYASFADVLRSHAFMNMTNGINNLVMKEDLGLGMNMGDKADYDRVLEESNAVHIKEERVNNNLRPDLKQEMKQEDQQDSVQEIKQEDESKQELFEMNGGGRQGMPLGFDWNNLAPLLRLFQPAVPLPAIEQKKALFLYLMAMKGNKVFDH